MKKQIDKATENVKKELKNSKKKVGKLMNDFSSFAMKGNVVDLAVGVVMGSSFGKIVTSLVNDLVMPAMSLIIGEINLAKLSVTLLEATEEREAVVLTYGNFLQTLVEFLIIAFSIFLALRYLEYVHKKIDELKKKEKKEEEKLVQKEEEKKQAATDEILMEIRDLLKEKKNAKAK
mgnify:CR=1 FL=1